jgi:hypothetical protein
MNLSTPTATGQDRISGGGTASFIWSVDTIVTIDELLLFEKIRQLQQEELSTNTPTTLVLADYIYPVTDSLSTINSRSQLTTHETNWGGLYAYIKNPVILRVPENHITILADNFWSLKFDAKELI